MVQAMLWKARVVTGSRDDLAREFHMENHGSRQVVKEKVS
jgi:hypothetical protein